MEKPDLDKMLDEIFNPTETPSPLSLESISPRLPPEGRAWLNSLNPFCRQAVELGSQFAIPCKHSNATSVHPMIGNRSEAEERLRPVTDNGRLVKRAETSGTSNCGSDFARRMDGSF